MAEPYRFGGPIPESVARLKSRRVFRASSLYSRMKGSLGEKFDEERVRQQSFVPRSPEHADAAAAMVPFEARAFLEAEPEACMPVSRSAR
jgi:hypothetical protein